MVAESDLPNSDDAIDVNDVSPDSPCQSRRRKVIATGQAPGGDSFLDQSSSRDDQGCGTAGQVIGTQNSDDTGRSTARESAERDRGYLAGRPGFAAATDEVDMAIDEPWDDPGLGQVRLLLDEPAIDLRETLANPDNLTRCHHQITDPEGSRGEELRVAENLQHEIVSAAGF
jgi:hypothetical protein